MKRHKEFKPNWVSKPGTTIEECMEERNISYPEMAIKMQLSVKEVEELIDAKIKIDDKIAKQLSEIFGVSTQFWINREQHYREGLIRLGLKE